MRGLGYSLAAYSWLWTINGVVIVLGQPLVSATVRRWFAGLRAQIAVGSLLFALAFALIARWHGYQGYVIGMVVLTIGEMLVLPAPAGRRGRTGDPGNARPLPGPPGWRGLRRAHHRADPGRRPL